MINAIMEKKLESKAVISESVVTLAQIGSGLKALPSLFSVANIDDERIVDYIVYQLYRYRTAIMEGRWELFWLFSPTAIEKYRHQFISEDGKSGMNYYINKWLEEGGLTRKKLADMIADKKASPLKPMVYMANEEPLKQRFINTKDGLDFCQATTTGWSPLSDSCLECKYCEPCMEMTEQKFPELMRYRKEFYDGRKKK